MSTDPRDAEPLRAAVIIEPHDPRWPEVFEVLADAIRGALGTRAKSLDHVGSTSVPGLAAKPVIDIVLTVHDSAEEADYRADLESAGFEYRFAEPDWFEHRLFKRAAPAANLHVFSEGCEEVERMLAFRDWLRTHSEDLALYQATKLRLAKQTWARVQDYADAKTEVVLEIMQRALGDRYRTRLDIKDSP